MAKKNTLTLTQEELQALIAGAVAQALASQAPTKSASKSKGKAKLVEFTKADGSVAQKPKLKLGRLTVLVPTSPLTKSRLSSPRLVRHTSPHRHSSRLSKLTEPPSPVRLPRRSTAS